MLGLFILFIICGTVALALLVFGIGVYNQLVLASISIDKAWANIDQLLKQRYDKIPPLLKLCEEYIAPGQEALLHVAQARTAFLAAKNPRQVAQADAQLKWALAILCAPAENYAGLKTHTAFARLLAQIDDLQDKIADRRAFYNESVAVYNARIRRQPIKSLAGMLGYTPRHAYTAPDDENPDPAAAGAGERP